MLHVPSDDFAIAADCSFFRCRSRHSGEREKRLFGATKEEVVMEVVGYLIRLSDEELHPAQAPSFGHNGPLTSQICCG